MSDGPRERTAGDDPKPPRAGLLRSRRGRWVRPPVGLRTLVRAQRLRFSGGNAVDLYHRGRDGLEAMLAAIEEAHRRIHLETYILRGDATGRRFLGALAERARRGVSVHLLYDAVGSLGLSETLLRDLRRAGADAVAFNPLHRLAPRWAPRRRDHRKILTVDGRVAFTGGLNLGDEYWTTGDPATSSPRMRPAWRDAHLRLRGPVVRDLDAVFLETWFRADGPDLPWAELVAAPPDAIGEVRCAVVPDGPSHRRRRARDLLLGGLREARGQVLLVSPYFAPGRRVLTGLADAAARGVAVDLLLAGTTDHPSLRRAARALIPRLLDRGVRVHEYEPAMMHAKVSLFDDDWAVVGTSNLDLQSLRHSYEVNVVLEGGDIVDRLRERFGADLEASRSLSLELLRRRGPIERLLDRLAALLLRVI